MQNPWPKAKPSDHIQQPSNRWFRKIKRKLPQGTVEVEYKTIIQFLRDLHHSLSSPLSLSISPKFKSNPIQFQIFDPHLLQIQIRFSPMEHSDTAAAVVRQLDFSVNSILPDHPQAQLQAKLLALAHSHQQKLHAPAAGSSSQTRLPPSKVVVPPVSPVARRVPKPKLQPLM